MSRRAWRSWPLILASSLLPGLVLFAWRAGSAPSAPSDSYVDGIVVTPVIADLGAIAAGETQEVVFRLANQRNAPVIIGSVTSDCGCTTVRQPRGAIEPGRFADFPVAYQASPSAAGEYAFVRRVTVRLTVDAKEREIDLRLTGRVVPRRSFGVYPSTLDYGDVGPGAQLTKFLHVRGAPGAVHAFPDALTLDAPGQERSVRVDYGTPVGDAVQKRVAVSLHVPDGAKPGLWEAQITLVDSGSTVSSERTVRIVARVRSPVVVEPSAVLLVLGHGKTAGAQITVTAHGQPRTPLVRKVSSELPLLLGVVEDSERGVALISVAPSSGVQGGPAARGAIRIVLMPPYEDVVIPVIIVGTGTAPTGPDPG